jgi:F0F1-type ATP synthase assembly protein I
MTQNIIDIIEKRYRKYSLWIIALLVLLSLLAINVASQMSMINGLIISACYSLFVSMAYGYAWRGVAKSSPSSLTKFYLAASAIRMLTALAVILIYCVVVREHNAILKFVALFLTFYIVMLVFECIFFAKAEKQNIKE